MASSTFLISITGQLEYIDILAAAGSAWHCKYEFLAGTDWKIIGGIESGITQIANVVTNGDKVVLNFPLEVIYKSSNIHGWPQIVVSVYRGMQLEGYGRIHMPLKTGFHKLTVPLSKPQVSSLLGYIATYFGYQSELIQPKMLATTAGNSLLRMVSTGELNISINVVMNGMRSLGYDVGKN